MLSRASSTAATKIFQEKPEFQAESIKTVQIGNGSILHFFEMSSSRPDIGESALNSAKHFVPINRVFPQNHSENCQSPLSSYRFSQKSQQLTHGQNA
jgi:hypothetical protein